MIKDLPQSNRGVEQQRARARERFVALAGDDGGFERGNAAGPSIVISPDAVSIFNARYIMPIAHRL
jgi:hypothetical protein